MLADHFPKDFRDSVSNYDHQSLTKLNKAEVSKLFNHARTSHVSVHGIEHSFVIPFAVAKIQYNIHGKHVLKCVFKMLILKRFLTL